MAEPLVTVEDLVFEYPSKRALFGVGVTVPRGSITALVGPNGAGKTTLIRCLAGLHEPFSGRIKIGGIDVHDHPRQIHKRLGYLADFFGLYEDLSVARCLTYAAWVQGCAPEETDDLVRSAAERLDIADRLGEKAGALSRGLKQRLAIAQSIIHKPEFLILDEPASGLDPDARFRLSNLLVRLKDEGMTLLVSSHILSELEDYATGLIVIRDGRVVSQGLMRDVGGQTANDGERLALTLTEPDPRLENLLAGRDGVSAIHVENRTARCRITGGEAARHALLKSLLDAGLAVVDFRVEEDRLRDAYMATAEPIPEDPNTGGDESS
ncbi:MAG: ABC transporter ATP-binding protein [Rhodospirillales bacterium]|nr:ABC transporter ATP-binding protein [Alphaproteobacteria bacterium]MBL6948479.1 ABC transporter ATP-binding protein [Rhodospirillales bacterium]